MNPRVRRIVSMVTLFGVFFVKTRAAKIDFNGLNGGHPNPLTDDHSYHGTPKRMPGFVRIGRQGNFIRIGRPNTFVRIGRDGGLPYDDDINKNDMQEQEPSTTRVERWYPIHHRFIRIGRPNNIAGHSDGSMSYGLPGNGDPIRIRNKKSNFVRIGRHGFSDMPSMDSLEHDTFENPDSGVIESKRMPGFVRIGKDIFDASGQPLGSGISSKRMPGFVRIGKDSESYPEKYVAAYDTDDVPNNKKRASNFVRIGKTPTVAQGKVMISEDDGNIHTPEETMTGKDNSDFVGLGNESGKSDGAGSLSVYIKDGFDSSISGSTVGNGGHKTDKRSGPEYYHGIGQRSSKRSDKNMSHRLSNFIDSSGSGHNDGSDRFKHFKQLKRSASMIATASDALGDPEEVIKSDRPMDTASRRSAFVRIGKIPSSAFVRIGKNFDRVLEMPITNNRQYHHHYRRGHSSFVRIG